MGEHTRGELGDKDIRVRRAEHLIAGGVVVEMVGGRSDASDKPEIQGS